MKAYNMTIPSNDDLGQEIIWAKNTKEARKKARLSNLYLENAESFSDLSVSRSPEFDDCENMNSIDFAWKQHCEGWEWYEFPKLNNENLTKADFIKIFNSL